LANVKSEAELANAKSEAALALSQEEKKLLELQLLIVNKELLQSKQAVTSRGILEYFLKGAQLELGIKGNFNAAAVCDALKKKQKVIVFYTS